MNPPSVFISYSHDSAEHKDWILKFAGDLRKFGVDATLDRWDLKPGQDVSAFMQRGIAEADRVLLVCSKQYVKKADIGSGGVGYERLIVTSEVVASIDTKKFIPVVRNNDGDQLSPRFLGPRLYLDFNSDEDYDSKLDELLRELLGAPEHIKPPIGDSPFLSGVVPGSGFRSTGPTGLTSAGSRVIDDEWFKLEFNRAIEGLHKQNINAYMEVSLALHEGIGKSQAELLAAVRQSEIHTFGWPIAITLENRDEYRPRPYKDGIRAEISIVDGGFSGRNSYDYWALRSNGDFYFLQSLFEDQRVEGTIFFNTRIIRITEALLFASNLYKSLGAGEDTSLSVRISHVGLKGRTLSSSSSSRWIGNTRKSGEEATSVEIVIKIGDIRESLVECVKRIAAPMFILFDYAEFGDDVYTDIVRRFEKGEVT